MSDIQRQIESAFVPFLYGEYELRVTRITVAPTGEPVFSERATDIEINDEANGEFVIITQKSMSIDAVAQRVSIDPTEWAAIRAAVDCLLSLIRNN